MLVRLVKLCKRASDDSPLLQAWWLLLLPIWHGMSTLVRLFPTPVFPWQLLCTHMFHKMVLLPNSILLTLGRKVFEGKFCKVCYSYMFSLHNVSQIRIYVWKERGLWFDVSTLVRDDCNKTKSAIVLTFSGLLNTSLSSRSWKCFRRRLSWLRGYWGSDLFFRVFACTSKIKNVAFFNLLCYILFKCLKQNSWWCRVLWATETRWILTCASKGPA